MAELENSGFASEGHESFPALYHDTERLHEVTMWTDEMLVGRIKECTHFLDSPVIMPRARATADRLIEHMMFELVRREDFDNASADSLEAAHE